MFEFSLHASPSLLMPSPQQGQQPVQHVLRVRFGGHAHLNGDEDDVVQAHQRQRAPTAPPHRLGEDVGERQARAMGRRPEARSRQNR